MALRRHQALHGHWCWNVRPVRRPATEMSVRLKVNPYTHFENLEVQPFVFAIHRSILQVLRKSTTRHHRGSSA